jgi:GGDEF domain-containing protein
MKFSPETSEPSSDAPPKRSLLGVPEGENDESAGMGAVLRALRGHDQQEALSTEENMRLTYELEHDEKTGILNELGFRRRLEKKLEDPEITKGAVIVIDLNDFKQLNDRFGHLFGDRVLIEFARVLRETVRADTDIAGRWHGDEFFIFVPEPTEETQHFDASIEGGQPAPRSGSSALPVLEKKILLNFRSAIQNMIIQPDFHFDEDQIKRLEDYVIGRDLAQDDGTIYFAGPVGFGIHLFDELDGKVNIDELLEKADAAMYVRKKERKRLLEEATQKEEGRILEEPAVSDDGGYSI